MKTKKLLKTLLRLYLSLDCPILLGKNISKGKNGNSREFEMYGPVKKVRIIKDKKNEKSRGYAFIEFESKRDMNAAYKEADGMKVDNRRIQVDYERARINKEWIPKR
jgi:U1 small nuclear ribonucleoprotein